MSVQRLGRGEGQRISALRLAALSDAPSSFGSSFAREAQYPQERWDALADQCDSGEGIVVFVAVDGTRWLGMAGGQLDERDRAVAMLWGMCGSTPASGAAGGGVGCWKPSGLGPSLAARFAWSCQSPIAPERPSCIAGSASPRPVRRARWLRTADHRILDDAVARGLTNPLTAQLRISRYSALAVAAFWPRPFAVPKRHCELGENGSLRFCDRGVTARTVSIASRGGRVCRCLASRRREPSGSLPAPPRGLPGRRALDARSPTSATARTSVMA